MPLLHQKCSNAIQQAHNSVNSCFCLTTSQNQERWKNNIPCRVHAFALPGLQAEFAAEGQQTVCCGLCTSRPLLFPGVLESPILLRCFLLLLPSQCLSLTCAPAASWSLCGTCWPHVGSAVLPFKGLVFFFFSFPLPPLLFSHLPLLS